MEWSKIPSLAALRAFEAAARCQSFSKAARELNVTHAAIAQHVRSLEAEFAQSLIQRQGRGIATTHEGAKLAAQLRAGFGVIADGVDELRSFNEARPLNISLTPAFAGNWLMPRIGEFWSLHPDISININPATRLVDLKQEGFDLGIRYGRGDWPGTKPELLTEGSFLVVVHPDLVQGRDVTCLADVVDVPWVVEKQFFEQRSLIEREGIDFEKLDVTELTTTSLVLSAAKAGLGMTILSSTLVEPEISEGKLVKVCELRHEKLGYYLVPVHTTPSKNLSVFMKWLHEKVQE